MDSSSRFNNSSPTFSIHTRNQYEQLQRIFVDMKSVLVAFSGGVDSALLLKIASDTLGARCTGVLGVSPSLAQDEKKHAIEIARKTGAELEIVYTREMENPLYLQNDRRRCFYCKHELYNELWRVAKKKNIAYIVDGTNADDAHDYRPGMEAARELKIRSPFLEIGMGKTEIRALARELDVQIWNKPAQPCLASRVMYGQSIDTKVLNRIDRAERFMKDRGYTIVRVRSKGTSASVEVGKEELKRLLKGSETKLVVQTLCDLGFHNVYIDPEGYRQGKLNTNLATD